MNAVAPRWDITRIVLHVLSVLGLTVTSLWLLSPFIPSVIWATMIVVATWPAMRAVEARLWERRALAVAVMTLALLVVVVVPLAIAVVAIATQVENIVEGARSLVLVVTSGPPEWIRDLPLVGQRLTDEWARLASSRPEDLTARLTPYVTSVLLWGLAQVGGFGALFVQFFLTVVMAAILYSNGETAAAGILAFMRRLAGDNGDRVVVLSAQAIRAVALGVVVTALAQSIVGGIGLLITGVPYPMLLTAVMLLLGVAQIGALPVMVGAVSWLYWQGDVTWGTVMLVWAIFTTTFDNFLRPFLIRRGADLPLLLIFAGVIGGLLALGVVGLFVGPVLFAVTYTLLTAWVQGGATGTMPVGGSKPLADPTPVTRPSP
jgi:predicted PurR-regulated permease PerM